MNSRTETDREMVYVEDIPRRILGNLIEDGADGQCWYIYAGIGNRCPKDAVAYSFMDHGNDRVRVEMCADHAREEVPEPPRPEQKELVTDGGAAAQRVHEADLRIREDGTPFFDIPDWFFGVTGRVSVMTPYATTIVTNKQGGSIAPFSRSASMMARHYVWPDEMTYDEIRHEELEPDKLRIKPWGEDGRIYRISVIDEREDDSR